MNARAGFAIGVVSCVALFSGVSAYLSTSNDLSAIPSDSANLSLSIPFCESVNERLRIYAHAYTATRPGSTLLHRAGILGRLYVVSKIN